MNTFSFLIAFSAVLCGALANPPCYGGNSGSYNNNGQVSVRAWEEPAAPCEGSGSGARVQVSTSSDYNNYNNAGYSGSYGGSSYGGSYGGSDIATSMNGGAPCPPARTTYQQHPGFNQQNERGEIIIHRPAPIIVKRPPTKVLVNHPPLVVKPAPVVLHRPPPMVVKPVLVRHHPQPVKVEPVYVKVMKPATSERYLLEDRQNNGCADDGASYNNYGQNGAIANVDTGCH